MNNYTQEILISSLKQSSISFIKTVIIMGILFPLWGIVYIVCIMFPLWIISDFFHIRELGAENNGFFIATNVGYIVIAIIYWLIFFIIALIKN